MDLREIELTTFSKKLLNRDEMVVLDIREPDAVEDWHIEGPSVELINEPYKQLKEDGIDDLLEKLPKEKPVVVVCAKAKSSRVIGEKIHNVGEHDVYVLEGGMEGWSEHLEPVKIGDLPSGGTIYQFLRLGKGCLSYLIESDGSAAIVDANRMTGHYESFLEEKGLKLRSVIDTHLHADHISGGRKLREAMGAEYWLPPKDAEEVTFEYAPLEDGAEIKVGTTRIVIAATYSPGHTIGSTSLILDDTYLLSGDILFVDSIGRPDLAGKAEDWVGDLRETLYRRYKELSGDLQVLPAHYAKPEEIDEEGRVMARLDELYEKNSGLQVEEEEEFRKMVTENLPPQPNDHDKIRKTNMGQHDPDEDEQAEMEVGPNNCAVS
ncbi:MBL fold metallo-hydrolase [Alteribacter keqinensis]|uniref:MBL fold metallo-hydrolase n=1 Tax=Alteribacter keqinensis TaxID=2483800 RepID=A0A3M7TNI9_9BACI|nr:MBL fold metallo-hydrolase [Alteribacter keqinensis]RNA67193.1 MBL fold metallo-hydrolase [Alteribacter keqinensis]